MTYTLEAWLDLWEAEAWARCVVRERQLRSSIASAQRPPGWDGRALSASPAALAALGRWVREGRVTEAA